MQKYSMESSTNDTSSFESNNKKDLMKPLLQLAREWYNKPGNYKRRCEILEAILWNQHKENSKNEFYL